MERLRLDAGRIVEVDRDGRAARLGWGINALQPPLSRQGAIDAHVGQPKPKPQPVGQEPGRERRRVGGVDRLDDRLQELGTGGVGGREAGIWKLTRSQGAAPLRRSSFVLRRYGHPWRQVCDGLAPAAGDTQDVSDPLRGEVPGQRLPIGLVQQVVATILQHDCARKLEPVGAGAGGHLAGAGARQRAVIEQVEHVEHRVGVFFDQTRGPRMGGSSCWRAHICAAARSTAARVTGATVRPDDVGAPRAEPGQQVAVAAAPLDDALQRGR